MEQRASPQHVNENNAVGMHRRNSFSCSSMDVIAQGKLQQSDNIKSPRKTFSMPTMTEGEKMRSQFKPLQQTKTTKKKEQPICAAISERSEAQLSPRPAGLMIDIKGQSGRFSDDDSDGGSSYSSASPNGEYSPTPSDSSVVSSSCTSTSPLLRRPSTGFEVLHSEASGPSSLDSIQKDSSNEKEETNDLHARKELEWAQVTPISSPLQQRLRADNDAGDFDDDLPDWLSERIVLSPAASMSKMSMRSPQQIEEEIRNAVNSAAARVKHELGRREQFQSDLEAAARYLPSDATSKTPQTNSNDSTQLLDTLQHIAGENVVRTLPIEHEPVAADDEERDLLLLMEVVIGDGRAETIEIREGDNPSTLAAAFAQKHALKPDAVPKLVSLIQDQLNALDEGESEEATQPDMSASTEWVPGPPINKFLSSQFSPPASAVVPSDDFANNSDSNAFVSRTDGVFSLQNPHEMDHFREFNYNNLMAKYGHYSQHSGKVDPDATVARQPGSNDTLVPRNPQPSPYSRSSRIPERLSAASTAPTFTTSISLSRNSSFKKKENLATPPAYERLYALAESKQKWIQRAQKAKELEQTRDQEKMHKVELMAAKSRELVANRTNGGYAHIGERLHDEALSDIAKKTQRHERRAVERDLQQSWMCPKCAFVNQYSDSKCQNVVALAGQPRKSPRASTGRREAANSSFGFLEVHPEMLCGQPKPERLFQPTLLTTSAGVMKAVSANKEKSARVASNRRQRHQLAMEEEFQQTCPFHPKINSVSEDIIREKLETAAAAAAVHGEPRPQRNPHLELYEDSFLARANREEQEQAYMRQFPFKPDIGVNALWVAPDKTQSDFVERLAVNKYQELERKRVVLYDKYAPDRDPHTGKKLFTPEVGRGPVFARNKQGLPIGEFLHAAHREQRDYHDKLQEKEQRDIKQKARQTFVSEASRQALERRKMDTCSRIYKTLVNLSREGLAKAKASSTVDISSLEHLEQMSAELEQVKATDIKLEEEVTPSHVDLSALPAEISRVVAIVFEFANYEPISRAEFTTHMDRLVHEVPGLTYTQIIFLAEHLNDGKSSRHKHQQHRSDPEREAALAAAEEQELTFHPAIDKNSREIAMKHGRVSGLKVFHALNQYFEHYQERKEQLRKQQQREFKKSHPFHPTFVTRAHQRQPAAAAFYDKIRLGNNDDSGSGPSWGGSGSVSSHPTSYQQPGGVQPPPVPLQTAITNARPSVRPIDAERSPFYTAVGLDNEVASGISRNSSGSQLEDAELTSRVLAALDEKPLVTKSSSCSYHFLTSEKSLDAREDQLCMEKEGGMRTPETVDCDYADYGDMQ